MTASFEVAMTPHNLRYFTLGRLRALALIAMLAATVGATLGCDYYDRYHYNDHAYVIFENNTDDPVDVYINDVYRASLSAGADIEFTVSDGSHELAATDNIGGDWGPIIVILDDGETLIYELNP